MTTKTADTRALLDVHREALADAVRVARSTGRSVIAGAAAELDAIDPVALFSGARARGLDVAAWIRPERGASIVGIGAALTFAARGQERIVALARRWRAVRSSGFVGTAPRAFAGVSFDERHGRRAGPRWDDFPPALLVVPRLLVEGDGTRTVGHAFALVGDDSDVDAELELLRDLLDVSGRETVAPLEHAGPTAGAERVEDLPAPDRWRFAVARTRADVRAGRAEKAVLARTVRVRGASDVAAALDLLACRSPRSTVFAVARGASCFVGATPESLVRLDGGNAVVACVAGTMPRHGDRARDVAGAAALAASEKERQEHAIVVREARRAIAPLCDDVASDPPRPLALRTVWHLASAVRGRARPGVDLLDLAAALHPTPAVCGYPRDIALRMIAEREPFDRGWYAGALGWVDSRGEGELVVALRSALVRDSDAWLFAGCGIVGGSEPEAELAESEAKLRPMLEALRAA